MLYRNKQYITTSGVHNNENLLNHEDNAPDAGILMHELPYTYLLTTFLPWFVAAKRERAEFELFMERQLHAQTAHSPLAYNMLRLWMLSM